MVKSDKKIDVVVAGHICFDVIPRFPKTGAKSFGELFVPGKLVNVGEVVTSTGGPVSNTGLGLHRLGAKVELMAKIGDDFFGKAILDKLKETFKGGRSPISAKKRADWSNPGGHACGPWRAEFVYARARASGY